MQKMQNLLDWRGTLQGIIITAEIRTEVYLKVNQLRGATRILIQKEF